MTILRISRIFALFLGVLGSLNSFTAGLVAAEQEALPRPPYQITSAALRKDLSAGNLEKLDIFFSKSLAEQWRTEGGHLYAAAVLSYLFPQPSQRFQPALEEPLKRLLNQSPDSVLANLLHGAFLLSRAKHSRGERQNSEVDAESWQPFRNDLAKAAIAFDAALALAPKHCLVLAWRLETARLRKEKRSTLDTLFETAARNCEDFILVHRMRLDSLSPQGGGSAAEVLRFARNAAEKAPKSSAMPILIPLAHELVAVNSGALRTYLSRPEVWEEVRSSWEQLLQRFPKSGLYAVFFANHSLAAGEEQDVETLIETALRLEPENPDVQFRAARYFEDQKRDIPRAMLHLSKALELDPEVASGYLNRGTIRMELKQFDLAELDFRRSIELDPRPSHPYYLLARLLSLQLKRFADAATLYQKAITRSPALDRYHSEYCFVLLKLTRYSEAVRECSIAIGLNENNRNAFINRSSAYHRLGKTQESISDQKAAARLERKRRKLEKSDSL